MSEPRTERRGYRILFDGYWLADGPPSGRNVVFSLITEWARLHPEDTLSVALPSSTTGGVADLPHEVQIMRVGPRKKIPHGVWATLLPRRILRTFDVVITQNFTPLLSPAKTVSATFIHDVLYIARPDWFTLPERAYLHLATLGARRSQILFTSSGSEAARIRRTWPRVAPRVHEIGLAVPFGIARALPTAPAEPPRRPFVLTVGRLNVRKNLERLISAYSISGVRDHADLLIVGVPDGRPSTTNTALPDSVSFTGAVSDAELAWYYERCALFVFPSLDEGFGLPLLEAKHFDARVAASDIGPFREMGLADVLFDPTSTTGIKTALESLYFSPSNLASPERLPSWRGVVRSARQLIQGAFQ